MTQAPCTAFEASNFTSSATKCKWCGFEEWQHKEFKKFSLLPESSNPIATDHTTLNPSPSIKKMAEEYATINAISKEDKHCLKQGFISGYKANNHLEEFEQWYKETIDANVYTNRKAVLNKIQELKTKQ